MKPKRDRERPNLRTTRKGNSWYTRYCMSAEAAKLYPRKIRKNVRG